MNMNDTAARIIRKLLTEARTAGLICYAVDDDGDELVLVTNNDEAFEAIDSVEWSVAHFNCAELNRRACVTLIPGNNEDCICDYTDRPEVRAIVERAQG